VKSGSRPGQRQWKDRGSRRSGIDYLQSATCGNVPSSQGFEGEGGWRRMKGVTWPRPADHQHCCTQIELKLMYQRPTGARQGHSVRRHCLGVSCQAAAGRTACPSTSEPIHQQGMVPPQLSQMWWALGRQQVQAPQHCKAIKRADMQQIVHHKQLATTKQDMCITSPF